MIANFIGIDKKSAMKFSPLDWLHHIPLGFSDSSAGKRSACNAGDPCFIPGCGRSPWEGIGYPLQYSWFSLVAQMIKNPPTVWETWFQSLGWEDPLEEGMATHSSILAWRIAMDRGAWWAAIHWDRKDSDMTELSYSASLVLPEIWSHVQNVSLLTHHTWLQQYAHETGSILLFEFDRRIKPHTLQLSNES